MASAAEVDALVDAARRLRSDVVSERHLINELHQVLAAARFAPAGTPSRVVQVANPAVPPARVRAMFKRLDKDGNGGLSIEEIESGFAREFQVDALRPHVRAVMRSCFDRVATDDGAGGKHLTTRVFSRFYAEMIFRHFDRDDNGTLELQEMQRALAFMVKPGDGARPLVAAYPPELHDSSGEVHLPVEWFWRLFSAME